MASRSSGPSNPPLRRHSINVYDAEGFAQPLSHPAGMTAVMTGKIQTFMCALLA